VYLSGQICFSALNAKTEFKLADMICVVFSYIDFNFHNGELELHLCTTCVRERAARILSLVDNESKNIKTWFGGPAENKYHVESAVINCPPIT
jgi:hypothetical protein